MEPLFADRIFRGDLSRRDFIKLTAIASAGVAASSTLIGCSVDPVTGEQTFVLMSEQQEIAVDKQQAPHQFSADYGVSQDKALNAYIAEVGQSLSSRSHRPHMPYEFNVVNATYINAYTFPGGSMATTRGILLELENEAELAGLLGHEIGHVNARHAAERQTKGVLAQAVVTATTAAVSASKYSDYAGMVSTAGGFGAGALLAKYSRDNEREADALGMEYMTRAERNPQGMVGLMEILVDQSKHKPSAIEQMFSSHPMSDERYAMARNAVETKYAAKRQAPFNRERYMDHTAGLRKIKPAIDALQTGESAMHKKEYHTAEKEYRTALKRAPSDYAGLMMMAKCQLEQQRPKEAQRYIDQARKAYPQEGQAIQLSGINKLALKQFSSAFRDFDQYEQRLPGNPNTYFLKAVAKESMQDKNGAAREYARYLNQVNQGGQAQHAHQRLVEWGYIKK